MLTTNDPLREIPRRYRGGLACRLAQGVVAVGVLSLVTFGLASCGDHGPDHAPDDHASDNNASTGPAAVAVQVGVVEAWTSPVERVVRLVGSTRAVDSVSVTAQATGTVAWIGFSDEQFVEEGTLLVRLDERRVAADERASRARMDRAKLRLQRVDDAYQRGAATLLELDDARTAFAESEAEHERDAAVLSDHAITAPFTGRITRRLVSQGALVSPGTTVAVLNTVDPIEISFSVPESLLADIRPGLPVQALSPAFNNRSFVGELAGIGAEIDPLSRAAEVFARIPNPDHLLRPGMFMTVRLVLGSSRDAVLLPESAIVVEGTRTVAFVVNDACTIDRRRVRIGSRFPGIVEIIDGVASGEVIVTSGVQRVRQGTLVATEPDGSLVSLGVIAGLPLAEQPTIKAARLERGLPADSVLDQTHGGDG